MCSFQECRQPLPPSGKTFDRAAPRSSVGIGAQAGALVGQDSGIRRLRDAEFPTAGGRPLQMRSTAYGRHPVKSVGLASARLRAKPVGRDVRAPKPGSCVCGVA